MFIFVSLAILALAIFLTTFVVEVVRTQKYGVREMTPVRVLLNWLLIIVFTSSLTGIGVLSVVSHSTSKVASSTVKSTSAKKTTTKSSSSAQKKKTTATSSSTSETASSTQEAAPSSTITEASTTTASSYVAYASSSTTPVTQGSQATYEEYWVEGELTSTTVPYSYTTSETTIVGSRTETVEE